MGRTVTLKEINLLVQAIEDAHIADGYESPTRNKAVQFALFTVEKRQSGKRTSGG